jgi:hypothetical protein
MAQTELSVPFRDGYNFGTGVDLLSGAKKNKPVNNDVINAVDHAGGATVDFTVQRIETTHDLETSLGIDAEASYGSPSFGAGVSARFSFVKKSKIQKNSLFMSITVTVKLKSLSIDAPSLTTEASKVVDRPDIFAQRFGNVFVRSMERGGIFIGVLRVDTSTSVESESIDTELKGSYGLFSAEAKMKFAEVERKFNTDVFVQMYHEGGPVDLAIRDPTNPLELLNNANAFLTSFQTKPDDVAIPYLVTLAPITIATGPLPPNDSDLAHAQDVMRFCASRRSVLLDQLNLLQLIVDRPFRYDFTNGANLKEIATAAADTQTDLDLVASCASAAINSPSGAKLPKDFASANGTIFPTATMPAILPQGLPRPAGPATGPPPLDSITQFALFVSYPGVLGQMKNDLPHSTPQVLSDAALGFAWFVAMAQAQGNLSSPDGHGFPDFQDMNSPIQRRATDKFVQMEPNIAAFGAGKFPDSGEPGLATQLSHGVALRQAMQEFGEDVSKITFS